MQYAINQHYIYFNDRVVVGKRDSNSYHFICSLPWHFTGAPIYCAIPSAATAAWRYCGFPPALRRKALLQAPIVGDGILAPNRAVKVQP